MEDKQIIKDAIDKKIKTYIEQAKKNFETCNVLNCHYRLAPDKDFKACFKCHIRGLGD